MKNQFNAIIEKDGEWYIAYCPEIPGANGQGKTKKECLESLAEAIKLILVSKLNQMPEKFSLESNPTTFNETQK